MGGKASKQKRKRTALDKLEMDSYEEELETGAGMHHGQCFQHDQGDQRSRLWLSAAAAEEETNSDSEEGIMH
jgi:hypothetical protein